MAAEQPPASSIPVLPPYPEIILAAIEAIGNGATKTKISRQILSTYDILPAAHTTLLSHHLNKMKASGDLVFAANNYAIPDPNGSPKRGRGRPAKPKEPVPEGSVAATSLLYPNGAEADPNASPKRGRGRPAKPKESVPEGAVAATPLLYPNGDPNTSPKRGRGRPAKPKEPGSEGTVAATPTVSGQKRGRGRPPKLGKKKVAAAPVLLPSGERRGRGRPRKTPVAAVPVGA